MIAALLLFGGMYLLAVAMPAHRALLWRRAAARVAPHAAMTGWLLIAMSLVAAMLPGGWIGVVTWFGLVPLCGGGVLALSTLRARKRPR